MCGRAHQRAGAWCELVLLCLACLKTIHNLKNTNGELPDTVKGQGEAICMRVCLDVSKGNIL